MRYSGIGFFISLGVVLSAWLVADAVKKSVPSNQVVKVRGVAEQLIHSDRVRWTVEVSSQNKTLLTAYSKVDSDIKEIHRFFSDSGILEKNIETSGHSQNVKTRTVYIDKNGNYNEEFLGYRVSRDITIEGQIDFALIEKMNKSINAKLLQKGVEFKSKNPYYYLSKPVSELKPQLLEAAAKSAYERATIIAKSSNSFLGPLKAARQGSFSGFGSDGRVGGYNTEHRISAVVTVDYSLR